MNLIINNLTDSFKYPVVKNLNNTQYNNLKYTKNLSVDIVSFSGNSNREKQNQNSEKAYQK